MTPATTSLRGSARNVAVRRDVRRKCSTTRSHILVLREADNRINLVGSVFCSKLFDDQGLFSLLPDNEKSNR